MIRALTFAAIVIAVGLGWLLLLPPAPLAQPLAFNHARHAGVACTVCHRGADSAARAGMPQGTLCAKCHATAPRTPGAAAIWNRLAKDARVDWVRVTRVPDHVMFSHRRHVRLGRLACASCHGDVGGRTGPPARAQVNLRMNGCLSCHQREGSSQDCTACHR